MSIFYCLALRKKLSTQKNIDVKFNFIDKSNHFYKEKEKELSLIINEYNLHALL